VTSGATPTIDPSLVERVLAEALATGGEFADLFAEDRRATTFGMEDDRLDRLQLSQERGIGVRVVADGVTGYAYARVGYHRSLDLLRRNGWKGHGPVPWEHEPNRGFLRCLATLARSARAIGEDDEWQRCSEFLRDSSPDVAESLLG